MKLKDRASFYHILRTGIKSGLTLQQVVDANILSLSSADVIASLHRDIDKGLSVSSALSRAGLISDWESSLIQIGETSGSLALVLAQLAEFFSRKVQQVGSLKSKLVFPFLTLLIAVSVLPLPNLVGGAMSGGEYTFQVGTSLIVMYLIYRYLLVGPIENARMSAFNPILMKSLGMTSKTGFLRQLFEIAYLDLFTLCLNSGMDVLQTLKLMQQSCGNKKLRTRHAFAISKVDKAGCSLTDALTQHSILQNPQIISFLRSSEHTGTLHSDLREFLGAQKTTIQHTLDYYMKRLSAGFYILVVLYAASKILFVPVI